MATPTFLPPSCSPSEVITRLQQRGFAVLQPADVAAWAGCTLPDLQALQSDWNDLPPGLKARLNGQLNDPGASNKS